MRTKFENTKNFFTFTCAWLVYATTQLDFVLPLAAFLILLVLYLKEIFGRPIKKSYFNMSTNALVSIAIIAGGLWRTFLPENENASSFIPILLPALQSGVIVFSVLAWFRFKIKRRSFLLGFLAWLSVALSLDVPSNPLSRIALLIFCVVSVGFIIAQLYFDFSPQGTKAYKNSQYRNFMMYSYPIFLGVIASVLFIGLVKGIQIGDQVFLDIIEDYVGRRHFAFFNSTLRLSGPGNNRSDVRPIMEIEHGTSRSLYLAGRIFNEFQNGIWQADLAAKKKDLPSNVASFDQQIPLTMFEHLAGIIPSPRGVKAAQSKGIKFKKNSNGIIFNPVEKIPKAILYRYKAIPIEKINKETFKKFKAVSPFLSKNLFYRTLKITGRTKDPQEIAQKIQDYFHQNFQYSLDTNFMANEEGLLYLLDKKPAVYCSYFASAMVMMLRAHGIPSRMVTGFLATETTGREKEKFIVRGRDAHAWVEALLPVMNLKTNNVAKDDQGNPLARWVRFDPTPSISRSEVLEEYTRINKIADWIWCNQKRLKAAILEIETKTLVNMLFLLVAVVVIFEILKKFLFKFLNKGKSKTQKRLDSSSKSKNPYLKIYKHFESILSNKFKISLKDFETNTDLIKKIREKQEISLEMIEKMEDFLKKYTAARFGQGKNTDFSQILSEISQKN